MPSRYLNYESVSKQPDNSYGQIVSLINDKLVNVNMGGAVDQNGSMIILEAVSVVGNTVPKIGDWVTIAWNQGQPVATYNSNTMSTGLVNINEDVKIISTTDIANNTVTGDHIQPASITTNHIQAGSIVSTLISAGTILGSNIAANTISGGNIMAGSITTSLLSAGSITTNLISAGSITTGLISSGAITTSLISSGAITTNLLSANAVTGAKIAAQTISGGNIMAGTITTGLLSANSITTSLISAGAVTTNQISANSITTALVSAGAITGAKIAANTISGGNIIAGTITTSLISAGAITTSLLSAGSVTTAQISAGAITTSLISAGAVTATQMQVGTITAASGILASASVGTANIMNGAITNALIGNAEITTAKIASGNITTALIQDAAITNAKISNVDAGKITTGYLSSNIISANSITGDKIAAQTISGGNILAGTIDTAQLKAGAVTSDRIAAGTITAQNLGANSVTASQISAGSIQSYHISTVGLDAQTVTLFNSQSGETLMGGGYLRVDGLDVGVVQSDNLMNNGEFLVASSAYGLRRNNVAGAAILGTASNAVGGHTVWKYDMTTQTPTLIRNGIQAGAKPSYVTVDALGKYAYVASQGDNLISKIDTSTDTVVAQLTVGISPVTVKISPDGTKLIVLNSDLNLQTQPDTITIIDLATFTVVESIIVGMTPFDIVFNGNYGFISTAIDGDIYILDLTQYKIVGAFPISYQDYPTGLALSDDGLTMFVACSLTNLVKVVDMTTYKVVSSIPVSNGPSFITKYNGNIYVACIGGNNVDVINIASRTKTATISCGVKPAEMVVNPYAGTAGYLFVADSGTNTVITIDLAINTTVGYLNAGANDVGLAFTPDYRYLYIANNGDSSFISFVYPSGSFIGDAYVGTDGTAKYYGADGWMPNRNDWMYDQSGNVLGASTVEFHLGEPLNNESGYVKIQNVGGVGTQWGQVEQDIYYVSNFSDGTAPSGTFFKYHNSSVKIMNQQPDPSNHVTRFEVDELVPKFVVVEDNQTTNFTPMSDGISQQYQGIYYSCMTNRALNVPSGSVTTNMGSTSWGSGGYADISRLVEGNTNSNAYFSNGVTGNQYVQVDLGAIYMVDHVTVWHYYSDSRKYHGTKTQVSTDGVNWVTVFDSAVSGEYVETSAGHTIYMNGASGGANGQLSGGASAPVRYVRDWLSGNTVNTGNHWVEIQAFGDWQVDTSYVYPSGTPYAGYPMTLNGSITKTNIPNAYLHYDITTEFTTDWYFAYLAGTDFGSAHVFIDTESALKADGTTNLYIFQNANVTAPQSYKGLPLKAGTHTIRIQQSTGMVSFDRFRFEDYQYYNKNSTTITGANNDWVRYKIVPQLARNYVGTGRQSTFGPYDTVRPSGSVQLKYRVRVYSELDGNGTNQIGVTYATSAIFEQGKLSSMWRVSQSSESYPSQRIELWNKNKPQTTGIQTVHLADGAVLGSKIQAHSIMEYHLSPYAAIPEYKLALNFPTHNHTNKAFLDALTGFVGSGNDYGTGNTVARGDHVHSQYATVSYLTGNYYTMQQVDAKIASGGNVSGSAMLSANNIFTGSANTFNHDVVVYGNLTVSGNMQYRNGTSITGDETINGNLTVTGNTVLGNQATTTNQAVRADRTVSAGNGLSGGGNMTSNITLSVAFGGNGVANTVSRSDHNHDSAYLGVSGTAQNALALNGISPSLFLRSDTANQTANGNFTITGNGTLYLGSPTSGGALCGRDNTGTTRIQLDGASTGIIANVNSYIGGNGNATFKGLLSANSLQIGTSGTVANLSAQYVNGIPESGLAKNASIADLGGFGIQYGLTPSYTTPTPDNNVQIASGTVYTGSGRRFVVPAQAIAIGSPNATYNRYDVVYVQGTSGIEGNIGVMQGVASSSPVEPTIPSDAVKICSVFVKAGTGSTTVSASSSTIQDERQWKPFYYDTLNAGVSLGTVAYANQLSSYGASVQIKKPILYTGMATTLTFSGGTTSQTWTHNLNLTGYAITTSCSSIERHVGWSNKTTNAITINLDDVDNDETVYVDVVIIDY